MLDQSFSADNFRKIIDIENRKGFYLEGEFFPEIVVVSKNIKKGSNDLRLLKWRKNSMPEADYNTEKTRLEEIKEILEETKEELYKEKLEEISRKVTAKGFKIEIEKDTTIADKSVYKIPNNLENLFTLKQLQFNFRKLYKVKQASRYAIVSHLKNLLDDGFPKIVVRTDIQSFYESIPQDVLLKKINDENLLTHLSRKFVTQILLAYNGHTALEKGVPRGIGISAYLVELFMREIDSKIKSLPNVIYYARYVDDIVVIFTPPLQNIPRNYTKEIKEIIENYDLEVNPKKTIEFDHSDKSKIVTHDLEYLGYRFIFGNEKKTVDRKERIYKIPIKVLITRKKKLRYKIKIIKAFKSFCTESFSNGKKARKLLVKRMRFLTGNTKLVNNKKNVATGVYFTNSLVNDTRDFKELDEFFKRRISISKFSPSLKTKLETKYSFEKGFNPTIFSKFTSLDLQNIMKAWKK